MEEYFEKKIKFITQGGPINGILKGFDNDLEVFKILINKEEFNLDVNDVLEMIPEDDSGFESDHPKTEEVKVEKTKQTISTSTSTTTIPSTAPQTDNCVTQKQYNEFLHLSFNKFGPSRDEFVFCGAQNLFKLIKLHLTKPNSQIDILLGGNTVFNSLGLTLARLLLVYGFDVRVVGTFEDIAVVKYFYFYKQNGGLSASKLRDTASLVINTTEDKAIDYPYPRLYSFGIVKPHPEHFLVCFGVPTYELIKSVESYFLVDVSFVEKVYKRFKISREGMKPVKKITKSKT